MLKLIISFSLLFFVISCGAKQDLKKTEIIQSNIFNGKKVTKNSFKSVVALAYDGEIYCSGNFISPTTLVTAAHCLWSIDLIDDYINSNSKLKNFLLTAPLNDVLIKLDEILSKILKEGVSIHIGSGYQDGLVEDLDKLISIEDAILKIDKRYLKAKAFSILDGMGRNEVSLRHKGFHTDIALIEFDKEVSKSFTPLVKRSPKKLKEVYALGFGGREQDQFGEKFASWLKVVRIKNKNIFAGKVAGICGGDSGGPSFIKLSSGGFRQVGINYLSSGNCELKRSEYEDSTSVIAEIDQTYLEK